MLASDEQAIQERCVNLSGDRWIDVFVGHYYDQYPKTPQTIVEVNRIRKEVVNQPEYIRTVAIEQLRTEGVLIQAEH